MARAAGSLCLLTALILSALTGCDDAPPRSAAEIEAAVADYLSGRTDLNLGDLQVSADRIRYDGDRAVASVSITAPEDPQAAMTMFYELRLGPDGWEVVPPAERPGAGMPDSPGQKLPPGHPPVTPPATELPPGHPPLAGETR